MGTFLTMGGRIRCRQCKARSKRTKQRCLLAAMRGKQCCAYHGGKSTGPRTEAGRERCAAAKRTHGNESRLARKKHSEKLLGLYELELLGRKIGLITGPKSPGRKPRL